MNALFRQLARPTTPADRRRFRLVGAAVTGCGMFLLAAVAILTAPDGVNRVWTSDFSVEIRDAPEGQSLAPYVGDPELRGGAATGSVLLVVPFVVFGLQALRTGTAARERRLAALSLAGATRSQMRRLAFQEGTRAAVIGGILAGPGYLLLWLAFGVVLPDGAKLLPEPGVWVLAGWPVIAGLLAVAGGVAAVFSAVPAAVSPLGSVRRQPRRLQLRDPALLIVLTGLAIGAVTWSFSAEVGLLVMMVAIPLLAAFGGPWLIVGIGRAAVGRGLVTSMAGHRLLADPRTPGRVAAVLFAVGLTFGIIGALSSDLLVDRDSGDLGFYLWGYAAAGIGALLAAVIAGLSLVVGVIEQVLDGRRGTAVLVALAASPRFVTRVVERQLLLAAVPAAVLGAVVGFLPMIGLSDGTALMFPACVLGAGLAAALGALIAARVVRPVILESSGPDNLRAP